MKNLVTKKNILIVSLLGIILGILFDLQPLDYLPGHTVGDPLLNFSFFLFLVSLLLLFVQEEVFNYWLKFAKWWLSLSLLVIILSPTRGSFFPSLMTRETASIFMGGGMVAISFIIIIYCRYRAKKK